MSLPKQGPDESDEAFTVRLEAYRERERERGRKWYHEHPEVRDRNRERARERRQDPAVRALIRERQQARLQDPEAREHDREYHRAWWRERHQDTEALDRDRRRQRERKRELRIAEIEACGNPDRCQCCGGEFTNDAVGRDGRHVDHRHDNGLIRGVVCARCNRELAVLDLRLDDPDRFSKLMAFSGRHAPTGAHAGPRAGKNRKLPEPDPVPEA